MDFQFGIGSLMFLKVFLITTAGQSESKIHLNFEFLLLLQKLGEYMEQSFDNFPAFIQQPTILDNCYVLTKEKNSKHKSTGPS